MIQRSIIWKRWKDYAPVKDGNGEEPTPFINTPYGYISVKMHPRSKSDFKFFVGNTNFDLGEAEIKIIIDTEGVDIFDIFSPYRFRIAIGTNFNSKKVMRLVEKRLSCVNRRYKIDQTTLDEIELIKDRLVKTGNKWIIYILPNGKYEYFNSPDKKAYDIALSNYIATQKKITGYILADGV